MRPLARLGSSLPLAHHRAALVLGVVLAASGARGDQGVPAPAFDSAFWSTWGDGQAELAGYRLRRSRYGEQRTGSAVLVFVTEPWSVSAHVKDEGSRHIGDVIQVLKLNTIETFQTGIYDYHLMTTSWTALMPAPGRPPGSSTKLAFSAQEWCGATWADVTFGVGDDARGAHEVVRSYFAGESGMRALDNPAARGHASLVEDALLVWARGLASPVVPRGASVEVAFLPALARARLLHTPLAWTRARLGRDATTSVVTVPAGAFEVERASVTVAPAAGGNEKLARSIEVFVEAKAPRRIVKVATSDGTVLELTGSLRTPYWQKNHEGDEALLKALGR